MPRPKKGQTYIDRFWNKVDKDGPLIPYMETKCWTWTGSKSVGYGTIRVNNKTWKAHRVSFFLHYGQILPDMCICHKCDNPSCVNPEHLFMGTKRDNVLDMERKGRSDHPKGDRHKSRTKPESVPRGIKNGAYTKPESRRIGTKNGRAKLTDSQIVEMRNLRKDGFSYADLMTIYKIGKTTVAHIVKGETWKHLII